MCFLEHFCFFECFPMRYTPGLIILLVISIHHFIVTNLITNIMAQVDKSKLSSWIKLTNDFYLDPDGILGKGCFGEVFRGYSMKLDSLIAIKTMQG